MKSSKINETMTIEEATKEIHRLQRENHRLRAERDQQRMNAAEQARRADTYEAQIAALVYNAEMQSYD